MYSNPPNWVQFLNRQPEAGHSLVRENSNNDESDNEVTVQRYLIPIYDGFIIGCTRAFHLSLTHKRK